MKLKITITSIFIFFLTVQISFGQNNQKEAVLFSELREGYCSETLVHELDTFLLELHNTSSAKGHIIFQGKNAQEGKNIKYFATLKSHITHRNFDPSRIEYFRDEDTEQMIMQFWIVPQGAAAPKLEKEFVRQKIDSTTRFDIGWADWHKWNGSEWTIYSYSFVNWGCDIDLNMKAFAETLNSQSNLTGYLVVYPKFGKGKRQAKKVTDFAVKELTQQYKVSKSKLKTIYGGNRQEPELELWFVPDGNKPPLSTSDKIIKD